MNPRIKAVVISHNSPDSTDELHSKLSSCFVVDVYDSGSDPDKRPKCKAERFGNLYWTGCWREAMSRNRDVDFLWVLCGDVKLVSEPREYLAALVSMIGRNVACWSPAISGTCRPVMSAASAGGRAWGVYNVEGQAMALSGEAMRMMGHELPPGGRLGWGMDVWMSWKGWTSGMRNVLDGRVSLWHPGGTGYDVAEARAEAAELLRREVGPAWKAEARIAPCFDVFGCNVRESTK